MRNFSTNEDVVFIPGQVFGLYIDLKINAGHRDNIGASHSITSFSHMHSFKNIALTINGNLHQFDFEFMEELLNLQLCTVTCEGRFLIINKDFAVVSTDMPDNWIAAAIRKLKELLADL